ncbi:hypothetical protein [Paenibacillus sp. PL2-23]|uniref:hypothetical protein n=1 Tax=Paenibacillus sp. PL2-23 TaxID=2100729 RepID=UPI0030F7F4C2
MMLSDRSKRRLLMSALLASLLTMGLSGCGGGSGGHEGHEGHGGGTAATKGPVTEAQPSVTPNEHAGHETGGAHSQHGDEADSGIVMDWRFEPANPAPGEEVAIHMSVTDASGKRVESFELGHEKEMHLIVVRDDLSEFYHVHPLRASGSGDTFTQQMTLPSSGIYKLFADFIPAGHAQMTAAATVKLEGNEQSQPLSPDEKLLREEQGVEVELELSSMKAGEDTELAFTLRDAVTKAELNDLEPYLGAIGHVVVIDEDLEHYLHVHPVHEQARGPVARFATAFPEPGLYRIWGQFKRNGETFVVPFTVRISS